MVSSGQFVGMGMALVLPVLAAAVLYIIVNRHSRKIETGMMGVIGYGTLGYLWQQLIYLMAVVLLTNQAWLRNAIGSYFVVSALVYGLVCSIFVALGMYWGIYLTNQKQRSIYRSMTIGIGFGLGNIVWNILAPYGMSLYDAIRINAGTFTGNEKTREAILTTASTTMYLDALKCILLLIIYMGVACVMADFYLKGKKWHAGVVPVAAQLVISLSNAFMRQYLPELAARIGIYVVLALFAAASARTVFNNLLKYPESAQD